MSPKFTVSSNVSVVLLKYIWYLEVGSCSRRRIQSLSWANINFHLLLVWVILRTVGKN